MKVFTARFLLPLLALCCVATNVTARPRQATSHASLTMSPRSMFACTFIQAPSGYIAELRQQHVPLADAKRLWDATMILMQPQLTAQQYDDIRTIMHEVIPYIYQRTDRSPAQIRESINTECLIAVQIPTPHQAKVRSR